MKNQSEGSKKVEASRKSENNRSGLLVVLYSFSSGILACLVSAFVKLAFNWSPSTTQWAWWLLRSAVLLVFAFVANTLMWLLFSRSLALTDKTVYATGLNKLANFVASALVGLALFDERFDFLYWSLGIALISLGLALIASSSSTSSSSLSSHVEREKSKIS